MHRDLDKYNYYNAIPVVHFANAKITWGDG